MRPVHLIVAVVLAGIVATVGAQAQVVWTVDQKSSLGWWQVNPHYNQLWATTCPGDPSWQPGEGRSPGWNTNPTLNSPRSGQGGESDTIHVPFYPRRKVRSECPEAVQGQVVLPDTLTWRGAHGEIAVKSDGLISGENMRDHLAKKLIRSTHYPWIRFRIDSLVDMTRQADSLVGKAMGVLMVNGGEKPLTAVIRAKPSDIGGTRVWAKLHMPASVLFEEFQISKYVLMGAGTGIWRELFMGVDLVMRPEAKGAN